MEENKPKEIKPEGGRFVYGFLMTIPAWILAALVTSAIPILANLDTIPKNEILSSMLAGTMGIGLFSLIIWIPLAIIAGNVAKDRGNQKARNFVLSAFFVFIVIVGGCFGSLSGWG